MSFRVSFCSCVFSVLLVLRLPRLGKRANLSAFRTFVRFVLVSVGLARAAVCDCGIPWTYC